MQLSDSDKQAMRRAEGWLELKLPLAASEELDEVQPELRAHPAVLKLRYQVYADAKHWQMAYEIANTLNRELPQDEFGGVHAAVALYRMDRTREAKEVSLDVAERFPKDWSVRYNLACYCAQLMEFEAAEKWLKAAMDLNEMPVKRLAIEDPDLQPLWDAMRDTR